MLPRCSQRRCHEHHEFFGHLLASPHTDGPNGTSKPTRGPVSTRCSNISSSLTIILLRCRCEVSRCRQTLQAAVRLQLIITVHATSAQAAVNNSVSRQSVSTQPVLRRLGLSFDLPFDYKGFASPHRDSQQTMSAVVIYRI